jgi:hypothetical protein
VLNIVRTKKSPQKILQKKVVTVMILVMSVAVKSLAVAWVMTVMPTVVALVKTVVA